jgi:hypothetical protein
MKRPDITIDVYRDHQSDTGTAMLVRWIDHLESRVADPLFVECGSQCPMCGGSEMHVHTPMEQTVYKNGVKAGRSQSSGGVDHD